MRYALEQIPVKVRRSSSMLTLALMSSQPQRCRCVGARAKRTLGATRRANAAAKWPHRWSQLFTSERDGGVGILASELKTLKGK